jgi:hypothetical protein
MQSQEADELMLPFITDGVDRGERGMLQQCGKAACVS